MRLRILVLIGTVSAVSPVWSAERGVDLPLYYDGETGNVTIDFSDVTGGVLSGYSWGLARHYEFIRENHTPFMDTFWMDSTKTLLSEFSWTGVNPGVYSLGNVLPSGLTRDELTGYFQAGPGGEMPAPGLSYEAGGAIGSAVYHFFAPQYRPSPFPALNDTSVGPPAVDWATEVVLTYNETNGELGIDATGENGGAFMSYFVRFRDPIEDLSNHEPITSKDFLVSTPLELAEVSMAPIEAGRYSIGRVLEPGLSADELDGLITDSLFMGEPQRGQNPLDINLHGTPMTITVVPEPSADLIFVTLVVCLGWTRCRDLRRRVQAFGSA